MSYISTKLVHNWEDELMKVTESDAEDKVMLFKVTNSATGHKSAT
jgi:hypothetical protein